ncbi:MAG: serine hydrolase domain-containing protein [Thermoanaerobaculia bacterium]
MTGRRGALVALFLVALGASEAEPTSPGPGSPAAWERIEAFVRSRMAAEKIPGLAIAVADSAGRTAERYFGVADLKTQRPVAPETLFQIGSLSKAFTAAIALRLSEQDLLDLDSPVTKVLPWFHPPAGARPPTIHQLLTHSAGLPADRDDIPSPLPLALSVRERRTLPGGSSGFHYSNIGYQLLGLVVEAASHRMYADLLRERILEPLGMSATSGVITAALRPRAATGYVPATDDRPPHPSQSLVEAPWLEYAAADGSILSTGSDMGRWLRVLLGRGAASPKRILSEESFARLVRPWVRVSPLDPWCYGYGLYVLAAEGRTLLRHTGGMLGFTSALTMDLGRGIGVVVLTNVARADARPTDVADFALKTLLADAEGKPLPDVPAEDRSRVPGAGDYAGTFLSASGDRLVFAMEGEHLFLVRGRERFPLEARGEDRFWVSDPDFGLFLLRFGRQNGRAVEAMYGQSWYVTSTYDGPRSFDAPKEWAGYQGHFRSTNLWTSNFRVFLRKGKLWMATPDGAERILVPLEPGHFRIGEERVPETLAFDEVVDGWAQRARVSGVDFYRFFTP